jgi:Zn/Cd-binding protein ZinT
MTNKKNLAGILGILLVFSFVLISCDNGGGGGDPESELAKWAGTWNCFGNYVNESWLDETYNAAASAASTETGQTVSADTIKGLAAQVFATPNFKSFVVQGDTITFYTDPNAGGTGTTLTYTYKQTFDGSEGDTWYGFEGDQSGAYKYLIAIHPDQDSPQTPVHFHFFYDATGLENAFSKETGMWQPVGVKQGTTNEQIIAQFQVVIAEIPWSAVLPAQ